VQHHAVPNEPVRPLLKWAGGKRQLLPHLRPLYPARFNRYIEPFLGSGAVFFDLYSAQRLAGRRGRLADANPDLVGCYSVLRDAPEKVIAALERLADEHRRRGDSCYYEVRDTRFNPARAGSAAYTPALAAMLIYLNRTGFNGLFRLNRRGEFNVPVGRYANPTICDATHLRRVAAALRQPGITVELASFEQVLQDAGPGDFVYCDPPYAPLSRTASFAHYTAGGFSADDQRRLQQAVIAAAHKGALVVLSNSSAPEIAAAYGSGDARRAGLRVRRVAAKRAINSRAVGRGPVDELLVTNAGSLRLRTVRVTMASAKLRTSRRTA